MACGTCNSHADGADGELAEHLFQTEGQVNIMSQEKIGFKATIALILSNPSDQVYAPVTVLDGAVIGTISAYIKMSGDKIETNNYILRLYDKVGTPIKTAHIKELKSLLDLCGKKGFKVLNLKPEELLSSYSIKREGELRALALDLIPAREMPTKEEKKETKEKTKSKKPKKK